MGKKSKKVAEEAEETMAIEEDTQEGNEAPKLSYEEQISMCIPIAHPMASRKLAKKAFKVMKKARKQKKLTIGVKAIKKLICKGSKGFVLMAGDVNPLDVISHFPILCEEHSVPYAWVPSRTILGSGMGKAAMIMVLVETGSEYEEAFNETYQKLKDLPHPV